MYIGVYHYIRYHYYSIITATSDSCAKATKTVMDVLLAGEGRELRRILVAGQWMGWQAATAGNGEEMDGLVVINGDLMAI